MKILSWLMLVALFAAACGKKNNSGDGGITRNINPIRNEEGAREELAYIINQYRLKNGLSPLRLDSVISNEAQIHAEDWSDRRVPIPHFGLNQRCQRIRSALGGYPGMIRCSELASLGPITAGETLEFWSRSRGNLRQLLTPGYNRMGVGVSADRFQRPHWVVIFYQR